MGGAAEFLLQPLSVSSSADKTPQSHRPEPGVASTDNVTSSLKQLERDKDSRWCEAAAALVEHAARTSRARLSAMSDFSEAMKFKGCVLFLS